MAYLGKNGHFRGSALEPLSDPRTPHYAMIREGNLLEIKKVECLKIEFLIMNQTYREKIVFLHVRRSPKQI